MGEESDPAGEASGAGRPPTADWPVDLGGVTETVVTTLGPNGRWNAAALGVRAPDDADSLAPDDGEAVAPNDGDAVAPDDAEPADPGDAPGPATARTWGRTRTRGNFERRGGGYVQFVDDPLPFVEAALGVEERDDPVLDAAAAWTRVEVRRLDGGREGDTEWVEWALRPVETVVRRRSVPTIGRGFGAVVEATVWASRLGVAGYDDADLRERLAFLEGVVDAAGDDRERAAFDRLRELADG